MRGAATKTRWLALLVPLLTAACSDDVKPLAPDGGTEIPDGGTLASCTDRPTQLMSPPTGQLPCELLPPGFPM